MKIILLYDNFIRDYRGLLLLSEFLKQFGHKVWIVAGWNDAFAFCDLHNIDVVVTGQIAESATATYGSFAHKRNMRLVINTSEPLVKESEIPLILRYGIDGINEDIIDMQTIGTKPGYDFILANDFVNSINKQKYKLVGFPRADISYCQSLRDIEEPAVVTKYGLDKYKRKYLFVSSFLLEGAFEGVPEKDLESWNIDYFKLRTEELLNHTMDILKRFASEHMNEDDVLLIKKHPWDCSPYFAENLNFPNCVILDNTEFITSCIYVSDVVIHTYSTSAVEAWIMNKPTVSLYLEKYLDVAEEHMKYERIAFNYEQLISFVSGQFVAPDLNSEKIFGGFMDGRASYRLAHEISRLPPKTSFEWNFSIRGIINNLKYIKRNYSPYVIRRRKESLTYYESIDNGSEKIDVETKAKRNTKYHDFLTWENQRSVVNQLYKKPIEDFVRNLLRQIKSERKELSRHNGQY